MAKTIFRHEHCFEGLRESFKSLDTIEGSIKLTFDYRSIKNCLD